MNIFKKMLNSLRNSRKELRTARLNIEAKRLFKVTEYDGRLWYSCDGVLVCPCSNLTHAPSEDNPTMEQITLGLMYLRLLYVQRNEER